MVILRSRSWWWRRIITIHALQVQLEEALKLNHRSFLADAEDEQKAIQFGALKCQVCELQITRFVYLVEVDVQQLVWSVFEILKFIQTCGRKKYFSDTLFCNSNLFSSGQHTWPCPSSLSESEQWLRSVGLITRLIYPSTYLDVDNNFIISLSSLHVPQNSNLQAAI